MRLLFVVPYPHGEAASQRYRVEQWLPILDMHEIKYEVAPFWSCQTWQVLYKPRHARQKSIGLLAGFIKRCALLFRLPAYDFVFIHREATPVGPPWFEWIAAKVFRKKIVFDFDDAIWLPNTTASNKMAASFKWHGKTRSICRWSDKVSCGNNYLLSFAQKHNQKVVLLPSVLDTVHLYHHRKEQRAEVVLGWIGSHSTLLYLQLIEPVLQRLEQKYRFRFVVIADQPPQLQLQSLEFRKWKAEREVQDLLELNIGLMPLPDSEWAKGKCAFKALQYMALGIPAVVSAVGANIQAVPNGKAGFACSTAEEWYEHLEQLINNPELREQMGANGQEWVRQHYSLQAYHSTFLSLFR
ncbi:glycosyltransferase involved in cell wall biosynthesis [Pontibacter ummariensis]|uniref:Glycosyltransferase involved in cell wall bisynthesis n=1 Tax=Pontibacter ummariensis TaxID=1610492 RepID=A0A239GA28_9BACT|nr:glycosyltransferase [Pontibacter ummariensis]PRY11560.1 glycosyltransferase involved in cell wall biosynthesis [Pontibacter ummariensis]SNS66186.1 Glycosyltransferase involved in cell wall bisynthesis [Pontibacter ummariensis]